MPARIDRAQRAAALLWWAYHPHLSAAAAADRLPVTAARLRRWRAGRAWKAAQADAAAGVELPADAPPIERPPAAPGGRPRRRPAQRPPRTPGAAETATSAPTRAAPADDPIMGDPAKLRGVLRRAALVDLEALQVCTAPKTRLIHAQTLKTILQIDPSLWQADRAEIDTRRSDRHARLLRSIEGAPSLQVIQGRGAAVSE